MGGKLTGSLAKYLKLVLLSIFGSMHLLLGESVQTIGVAELRLIESPT